jgi:hypothetical protein
VSLKPTVVVLLGMTVLAGCSQQPSEELRSDYDIVGREMKEFDDHSGKYIMVTIKYGDKRITAECSSTWTSDIGEDLPSTPKQYTLGLFQGCPLSRRNLR